MTRSSRLRWNVHVERNDDVGQVKGCIKLMVKGRCWLDAREDLAGIYVCRHRCDGSRPAVCTGLCQLEEGS